jgi:beta-galactosidase/beta-glucuronidase
MADASDTNTVDTVTKPDGTAASRTYSESEFKEVIAQRQALKDQLRAREEADKKTSDAKLLEEGKLKELLEAREKRLAELEGLEGKLKTYEAADAARREDLLKELPKEKRELYQTASEAVIRDAVELHKSATGEPTQARKQGKLNEGRKYADYTNAEILELKSQNPELYRTLYREWYKSKNGTEPPAQFLK